MQNLLSSLNFHECEFTNPSLIRTLYFWVFYSFYSFQFDSERERECFKEWLTNIYVIIGVIQSKEDVDCERFRELCEITMLKLKVVFPWALIGFSVHETLGHIVDIMEDFGGTGLGHISEVSTVLQT